MKKKLQINSYTLITIVLVPVLFIWFEPAILQLKEACIDFMIKTSRTFEYTFFMKLSLRDSTKLTSHILYILMLGIGAAGVFAVMYTLNVYNELLSARKELRDKIDKIKNPSENPAESNDPEEYLQELNVRVDKKGDTKIRNRGIFISFAICITLLFPIVEGVVYTSANKMIAEFEHKLKIISIKANPKEIKHLEYDWATMKNKEDYDNIMAVIEKIENE